MVTSRNLRAGMDCPSLLTLRRRRGFAAGVRPGPWSPKSGRTARSGPSVLPRPGLLWLEDQAGLGLALEHFGDRLVDAGQRPGLVNHPGPARGMQGEHVIEVGAGADDRTDHRLAVQHR